MGEQERVDARGAVVVVKVLGEKPEYVEEADYADENSDASDLRMDHLWGPIDCDLKTSSTCVPTSIFSTVFTRTSLLVIGSRYQTFFTE